MIIGIGSRSVPKVIAITRAFSSYTELWLDKGDNNLTFTVISEDQRGKDEQIKKIDNTSKVSKHPLTLNETITGAKNRAKAIWNYSLNIHKIDFSVGLEAGLFPVEAVETGYLDTSVCAIYDGKNYFIGCSPLFEYPSEVLKRVIQGEEAGYIIDYFGETAKGREGIIGPLTKGRVMRDFFEEQAVFMALTKIVRSDLYLRR